MAELTLKNSIGFGVAEPLLELAVVKTMLPALLPTLAPRKIWPAIPAELADELLSIVPSDTAPARAEPDDTKTLPA